MRNIKLTLAYDGTDFHGWQRQPQSPTVQECVEDAVERVTGSRSPVYGSGRTDAGVHAAGQVAHFLSDCPIPCSNLPKALNDVLPPSIRVKAAAEMSPDFHARYHAKSKTYRYRIYRDPVCPPFLWRFVYHYPYNLDLKRMAEAASLFLGKHDFTSFAAAEKSETRSQEPEDEIRGSEFGVRVSKPQGMTRTIFLSRLTRRQRLPLLCFDVRGSGFLHHMVRNIVGTLIEVGRGRFEPGEIPGILDARDRNLAGPTAPAQGLCLMKVDY